MKVWMLTGDKVETATCISISAGIKDKKQKLFTIKYDDLIDYNKIIDIDNSSDSKEEKEKKEIDSKVEKLRSLFDEYNTKIQTDPHLFIIDGDSLDLALKNLEEPFFI